MADDKSGLVYKSDIEFRSSKIVNKLKMDLLKLTNMVETGLGGKDLKPEHIREVHEEVNRELRELDALLQKAEEVGLRAENEKGKRSIKNAVKFANERRYKESLQALKESKRFVIDLINENIEGKTEETVYSKDPALDVSDEIHKIVEQCER